MAGQALPDTSEDVRLGIDRESWDWLEYTGRQCELLDAAEQEGPEGARAWLRGHGLRWVDAAIPTAGTSDPTYELSQVKDPQVL